VSLDSFNGFWLWSPIVDGGGFRVESISWKEYSRLSRGVGNVRLGQVAVGYSISSNIAISDSFGRVFVDGAVEWVVKIGDVIAVFQSNGRDHWFREVSN
jgi:hypothetical protein